MGSRRGSAAGQRGSASAISLPISETPLPGPIPLYEVPGWRERYRVTAGITGRGTDPGHGFDLGLWSTEPVGEVMSRWFAFRRALPGFHAVALGNQIHGVEVMSLDAGRGWIQVDGIDGWITTAPGVMLTVTVADCVPIYLVAPPRGVALLHAGWRGTAGRILARGIERLKAETGCVESQIVMHCGVGICGSCYEVGSEVMVGCGAAADGDGPWHIDLRERLTAEASELGLTMISSSTWCSAHDGPSFYSHRASGGTDGRMVAYIGMPAGRP
jgi:polyphenol oxidase